MKLRKSPENTQSVDYIPSISDYEARYPLSGNAELVINTYDNSRSSPVDITILGLSREQVNRLTHSLIHGDGFDLLLDIPGDEDDRSTALAIAEGELYTPRVNDLTPRRATGRAVSMSSGQSSRRTTPDPNSNGSGGIRRPRITDESLSEAIDTLRAVQPNGMGKSSILDIVGDSVEPRLWMPAVKALLESGEWRQEGQKKGAKYYAT